MTQQDTAAGPDGRVTGGFHAPIDLTTGAVGLALTRESMRAWLRAAGMAEPDLHQLLIAVGEACANVVEHSGAERSGEQPPAWIDASCDHGQVCVTVTDRGRWKQPDPRASAAPAGKRGRGWLMMTNLVDRARVRRDHNGTTVELVKALTRQRTHTSLRGQPAPTAPLRSRAGERLRITRGEHGELILAGDLDEGTARRMHLALQQADTEPVLLVDLCAVDHLQSAGIAVLLDHARRNLRLRVRADSGAATVIRICGLGEIVPVDLVTLD